MGQGVKVVIMLAVLAIWAAAMTYWIFFERTRPDPLSWGIPGAVYLTLWPRLPKRKGGDK